MGDFCLILLKDKELKKLYELAESKSDMYLDIIDNIINKSEDYLRKEINSEKELLNYVHKIK